MPLYPKLTDESTACIYDLRFSRSWMLARFDRAVWGRERTLIHEIAGDHIILEFMPDELEASA